MTPLNVALTIRSELASALERSVDQLISIAVGVLSIAVVILLARIVVRLVRKLIWNRRSTDTIDPAARTLINNGISLGVYFAAVTLLLAMWGASWATLLTAISISTLAVVLGLQDLLRSMLGGAFIILDQPYAVGDRILVAEIEGEVIEVRLRTTVLRSSDGRRVTLPNGIVLTTPFVNLDRSVTSATVITVAELIGQTKGIRAEIESALAEDPPIAATLAVSEDIPYSIRRTVARIPRKPGSASVPSDGSSVPLRIHIIVPSGDGVRSAERETVSRVRNLYPGANITVRRGAAAK